ncbi:hypothetical protein P1P68_01170 [Streptomyces scabiei]|uniref:hypothetical protein n=1 Tax=Streptomyces scabiei TaxID=1930 RepID=UPI00298F5D97|nr:hypothetical protein [Streptomyces scabiei]MDW8803455.1 hypothetical protein [Streptomyces scabiei]
MTETPSETTDLKAQYTAQVAADLERNTKEQERLHGEIEALQEQLRNLQQDHSVLANVQQALGFVAPEPAPVTEEVVAASVPRQKTAAAPQAAKRTRAKKAQKAAPPQNAKQTKKPAATKTAAAKPAAAKPAAAKTAAPKPATAKTATKTAAAKTAAPKTAAAKSPAPKSSAPKQNQPTLVELIRLHLTEQSEPRSAAEVAAALTQAHPDRRIQTNVVRTTLEGLVAKSNAQRSRQGSSVYYTAPDAPEAAVPSQAEAEPAPANG